MADEEIIEIPDTTTIQDAIAADEPGSFGYIEIMPVFNKKGYDSYTDFIKRNMRVLDDTATGKVFVSFTVEKTGEMTNIKVVKCLSTATENEALRLVSLMEFSPATLNERKVRLTMKIPLRFGKTE